MTVLVAAGDCSTQKAPVEAWLSFLSAFVWPLFWSAVLICFRVQIRDLVKLLIEKVSLAETFKLGPVEIGGVFRSAASKTEAALAEVGPSPLKEVPEQQVQTSKELDDELDALGVDPLQKREFAFLRLTGLASEYDLLREDQPSEERTRKMDRVVALMRTFALPAFPLLPRLTASRSAGERLAAIAILQVKSSSKYIGWLQERFVRERHAFLLFHAALVLNRMTKFARFRHSPELRQAIRGAITTVESYRGGQPDQATLDVLRDALKNLDRDNDASSQ